MQIHDIWAGLLQDKAVLSSILFWMVWGMLIILGITRLIWEDRLGGWDYLSLTLIGWVIPVFFLSLLLLTLGTLFGVHITSVVHVGLMFISAGFALWISRRAQHMVKLNFSVVLLVGVILLSLILLRLPFLTKTMLPLYFDSAEHYRIAEVLIRDYENAVLAGLIWPVSSYYHLGYHIVVAGIAATSQLRLDRMILAFGQIVLAFAPLSLFFIVWHETRSHVAGLFAVILGTFGWYMPAHAVNWGKYPALLSLIPALFSLSILYLYGKNKERPLEFPGFAGLISLSIFTSFLVHTRSLILIGSGVAAWMLAWRWARQPETVRRLVLGLVLAGLTGELVYVESNPVINALLDPYLHDGIWVTCAISLLAVLAYAKHPQLIFSCLLFMLFMILGLFVPVSSNTFFTLMDRPFVEMSLFIPLSIMGGLGFASVNEMIYFRAGYLKAAVAALLLGWIVFQAFIKYDFYPSDCCKIVGSDDLIALDWIEENLPADARILIPSSEIKIAPSGDSPQNAGSDAGVWIAPLTDRTTISQPYMLDFSRADTLEEICSQKITHVYRGGTGESFRDELLEQKPDWYETILFLPDASIYRVTGCA